MMNDEWMSRWMMEREAFGGELEAGGREKIENGRATGECGRREELSSGATVPIAAALAGVGKACSPVGA